MLGRPRLATFFVRKATLPPAKPGNPSANPRFSSAKPRFSCAKPETAFTEPAFSSAKPTLAPAISPFSSAKLKIADAKPNFATAFVKNAGANLLGTLYSLRVVPFLYAMLSMFCLLLLFIGLPSAGVAAYLTTVPCRILVAHHRRPGWYVAALVAIFVGSLAVLLLGGTDVHHPSRWDRGKATLREMAPHVVCSR